ncbi:hypothetical protein CAPN001_11770 [Capnocytophaga stomatis]|uniref:hypothetical protein n=1 Tax=Capnocytophaga stomatis TaxID=1848904 RepID=UPI0019502269|nr:hypothetical protein [Capnocytophaga stomatis]GIJ96608.1 hypothetical protein CAPN001_11770 [Capnocytophaga stomatis]
MKVSKKIVDKISNDNLFSLEVAKVLNKTQQAVILMAKAQSDRLLHYLLVEFYKSQGFTEDEIFEEKEKK